MKYYSVSHRDTFDTLWASGDAQTHARRFIPVEIPNNCSIAAGLCAYLWSEHFQQEEYGSTG